MKITFHGAARNVTGSQHLLEINGKRLLLDCGLFQGRRQESFELNRKFGYDPAEVDAVILSHAHIDHSGNLPNLVKSGYRGPIYASHVTKHLAEIMLLDSAHIQESDAEYLNRKNKGKRPPVEPLYDRQAAWDAIDLLEIQRYNQSFEPLPGVKACLVEAGHILGSAAIMLDLEENGRKLRLWYSGDIGRPKLPLVRDPVFPQGAQYLVMECTYGNKNHERTDAAYDKLGDAIAATIRRGGKVIVPAFAVGRTQDLVYSINRMMEAGELRRVPVIVDSPLAVNVSDIFRAHDQYYDDETLEFMRKERVHALGFDKLRYVRSVEESKALNDMDEPMIIISASGMAETGRILHHLKNNIGDPRNLILLVSYQAPHTLGRRLAEGEKKVRIFGEYYTRRAQVLQLDGFSAHADSDFLLEYALASKDTLECVFLVHGEADAASALERKLLEAGIKRVVYPALRQTVNL